MSKTVCIIQARMGSTRLPGKVMKIINNMPVLWHVINRVKKSKLIEEIVVATSELEADSTIEEFCNSYNILCFRGDEKNVLNRYYHAAKKHKASIIVRITSDCPLIDPEIIDLMLENYDTDWAYYSNCHPIRSVPVGLDVEITSFQFLKLAFEQSVDKYEQEHVFPFFYNNPDKFKIKNVENLSLNTNIRITLDTPEDYELIKSIYDHYKDKNFINTKDVITYLESTSSNEKK